LKERKVLDSWKEIAFHFDRSIKTCQRWETTYGMPIHRIDGSPKARVFAYQDELELWLDEMLHHREKSEKAASFINKEIDFHVHIKRRNALILAAAVIVLSFSAYCYFNRRAKIHWALDHILPQIPRLIVQENYSGATALVVQAEKYLPDHPELKELAAQATRPLTITTTPSGAEVYIKDYTDVSGEWQFLGTSPLLNIRISRAFKRWKILKEGFDTVEGGELVEGASYIRRVSPINMEFALDRQGSLPSGMVRVRLNRNKYSGTLKEDTNNPYLFEIRHLPKVDLQEFYLDKFEVTNEQYQKFVSSGGYQNRAYWTYELFNGKQSLSWEDAIVCLVDKTGLPGPSTWENGTFPAGQEDHPVSGVSWYEAAAYAEFAGKNLPTVYHWDIAAGAKSSHLIIPLSNFSLDRPAPVGSYPGLGPYGTYDMAGNVKEWCWNAIGEWRLTLGGGSGEHEYMFNNVDAVSPITRTSRHGFRCAVYPDGQKLPEIVTLPITRIPVRDFSQVKPASDREFEILKNVYAYQKTPLDAEIDYTDDSHPDWIRQRITYNAAYNNERMIAYLFLPKNSRPPYQVVLWFPGAGGMAYHYIEEYTMGAVDYIVRSGRAVIYPIYKGTFERRDPPYSSMHKTVSYPMLYKDLCCSIDYLETRPDIDVEKLAYTSFSWGTHLAAVFFSMEKRIKTGVLASGGFYPGTPAPVIDQVNFITRVTQPILMLNGRYDYLVPESLVRPFFELLGTPDEHKKLNLYPTDHSVPRADRIKDTLDWLDKYLGPVELR
jgi:formylglycine-generating enzyme required for sulfatase activity/dienelactone hydrolase